MAGRRRGGWASRCSKRGMKALESRLSEQLRRGLREASKQGALPREAHRSMAARLTAAERRLAQLGAADFPAKMSEVSQRLERVELLLFSCSFEQFKEIDEMIKALRPESEQAPSHIAAADESEELDVIMQQSPLLAVVGEQLHVDDEASALAAATLLEAPAVTRRASCHAHGNIVEERSLHATKLGDDIEEPRAISWLDALDLDGDVTWNGLVTKPSGDGDCEEDEIKKCFNDEDNDECVWNLDVFLRDEPSSCSKMETSAEDAGQSGKRSFEPPSRCGSRPSGARDSATKHRGSNKYVTEPSDCETEEREPDDCEDEIFGWFRSL